MSLKTIIKNSVAAFMLIMAFALPVAVSSHAAVNASTEESIRDGVDQAGGDDNSTDLPEFIKNIVNILLFVIGAVSVIVIIVGGIRYVTSAGDSSGITGAKNTILYAVVGLVVAFMAYAIVNFVLDGLS